MQKNWPHFSNDELRCKCGCGMMLMHPDFMRRLESLRKTHNKPMLVSSAYRCPNHNNSVSHTGSQGPHTTGMAIDILISGEDAYELIHAAIGEGFAGIGVMQHGPHEKRFIHLDRLESTASGPRPRVWSYSS